MRDLVLGTFVTLDGRVAAADGGMDWNFAAFDDEVDRYMTDALAASTTMILGRRTYEMFADYWPKAEDPGADYMNGVEKVVFSRTLDKVEWSNSRLAGPDTAQEIAALKQQPGKDMTIVGSITLANDLINLELVDRYVIWVHPVILASGQSLWSDIARRVDLTLTDTRAFKTGLVILTYVPATSSGGAPKEADETNP